LLDYEIEWFQVYFLEWLHLVTLGDRCGYGFLVTLDGGRHLDGLEQRWRSETSWWLFVVGSGDLVRGIAPFPAKNRKVALVNCSCHWVTSLVGQFLWCPMCGRGSCNTSLPPNHQVLVDTAGTILPASTWSSGEKSLVSCHWISHALGKAYGGEAHLLKCLSSQRFSLNKEGLGYTPKKGKTTRYRCCFAEYHRSPNWAPCLLHFILVRESTLGEIAVICAIFRCYRFT
jgi:hypothetical protein